MSLANPLPVVARWVGRRSLGRRWGFWFALAVVGCLTAAGVRSYQRHRQAVRHGQPPDASSGEETVWRLQELQAARPVVADADNAALRVQQADALLPTPWLFPDRAASPLTRSANEPAKAADLAMLRAELNERSTALAVARGLADLPAGRFPLTFRRNVFVTLVPHAEQLWRVTSLLCLDALRLAEDGQSAAALRSCRAALNAARAIGDEPLPVSQMTRMRCVRLACRAIEGVLARGAVDADELRLLQELLETEERYPRLLALLRAQRACVNDVLDAVESGRIEVEVLNRMVAEPLSGKDYTPLTSAAEVRAEHPWVLRALHEAVAIAKLPPDERPARIDAYEVERADLGVPSTVFALMYDLRKMDTVCRRADAGLRCLTMAVAAERYRLRHGRWPDSLGDLTPGLAAAVPLDPADGAPLGYRRYEHQVAVYSRLSGPLWGSYPPTVFNPDEPAAAGIAVRLFNERRP